MKKEIIKCECPYKSVVLPAEERFYSEKEKSGMNHEPNKCKGTNDIKKYRRNDKELYLCSCCVDFGDVEIKEPISVIKNKYLEYLKKQSKVGGK